MLFIAGLWPFNFTEKNNAAISAAGGLEIARHGTAYTALPAGKLQGLKQFAIYLDVTTSSDGLSAFEKIFSYAINQEEMNFLLGQWRDGFIPVLRTEQKLQGIKLGVKDALKKDERTQFLINCDGMRLFLYRDGIRKNYREVGTLSFSNWNRTYPLVVGTDAVGRAQWQGTIYVIAIYDRALSPKEISAVASGQWLVASEKKEESKPLIHYVFKQENTYETEFRGGKALAVRDLGNGEPADLVIPEQFMPYKRSYIAWDPDWLDYRTNWLDLAVNILGFIPFGALLLLVLGKWENPPVSPMGRSAAVASDQWPVTSEGKKKVVSDQWPVNSARKIVAVVGLAVVVGVVVSFAIEYMQAYLPSRDSSLRDLVTNTAGTLFGALAAVWYSRKRATATSA